MPGLREALSRLSKPCQEQFCGAPRRQIIGAPDPEIGKRGASAGRDAPTPQAADGRQCDLHHQEQSDRFEEVCRHHILRLDWATCPH